MTQLFCIKTTAASQANEQFVGMYVTRLLYGTSKRDLRKFHTDQLNVVDEAKFFTDRQLAEEYMERHCTRPCKNTKFEFALVSFGEIIEKPEQRNDHGSRRLDPEL